jgi:mannitol 2-dehydrogenase
MSRDPDAPAGPAPLSDATLARHEDRIAVPTHDRSALVPAVVHLGVGGFRRAHQALYLDRVAEAGCLDWGVVGVALRRPDMKRALEPQDGLFTVVARDEDGDTARVVGSVLRVLHAPEEPEAVLDALADARTRVVTLTVTGGDVLVVLDQLAGLRVAADLADPEHPRTAAGYLVEALARRRAADGAGVTVLSCDNVPHDGRTAQAAVVGLARRRDAALAAWVQERCSFPNTVVDRITPESSDETRELVAASYDVADRWPVVTRPSPSGSSRTGSAAAGRRWRTSACSSSTTSSRTS